MDNEINEIKDTVIHYAKEDEIKFSKSFKFILSLSIFLTGIVTFAGIAFVISGFLSQVWVKESMNYYLLNSLIIICITICFAALIGIAVMKKPFSKILIYCIMTIGIIFVLASLTFSHIPGYKTSGFTILSDGSFTLFDGTLLMFGVLGILFAKIMHYGFLFQKNSDLTV